MTKPAKNKTPRLSVPPPGVLAFADGGTVRQETADELMARIAGKYGVTGQAPAAPVQQSAPQPQPKPQQRHEAQGTTTGIIGILKNRGAQIDKAVNGYAEGGKISGPGTPKSDSIPATVHETGEQIKVSTQERIVSAEQGRFLEDVAKNAGFDSLDAMLEFGTGKPVGPTIKAGKRAAEDGMSPELSPFAYRGASAGNQRVDAAITAPPTLSGAPIARSESVDTLMNPVSRGLTVSPFGPEKPKLGSGLALDQSFASGQVVSKHGRDTSGIITAESGQAAAGSDMQRSGGVFGSIDMKGANEIMARENAARQSMIDSQRTDNQSGGGVAIMSDGGIAADNAEKTARWRQDDLLADARRGNQSAVGAAIHANAQAAAEIGRNSTAVRGQDLDFASTVARLGLMARGQDLVHERGSERNDIITRGQDKRAETALSRIASDEAIASARISERGGLSLAQQRGNAEIDAARQSMAGLTPEDIRRKTAKTTNTGRENQDYDEGLSRAMTLANRRKVGDDPGFDQRQQAQPQQAAVGNAQTPAYDRTDIAKRFRSEREMDSHKLGNDTPNGVEVLDASGKLIGHYR